MRDGRDGRTGSNGYKNGLDFIITLVVVNSLIVRLLHRLILVILSLIELKVLPPVNFHNSFLHRNR